MSFPYDKGGVGMSNIQHVCIASSIKTMVEIYDQTHFVGGISETKIFPKI